MRMARSLAITSALFCLLLVLVGAPRLPAQSLPIPQISNLTANSFTVSWTTSDALNTQVWYGVGNPYQFQADWTLTTTHTATITGLQPNTTYAVRVESSFYSDPDLTSTVFGVTTPGGAGNASLAAPVVSDITESGFTLSWTTDQPLNTQVHYGVGQTSQSVNNWTLTTNHTMVLSGLQPGTTYSVQTESSYFSNPDLLGPVISVTTSGQTPPEISTPVISDVYPDHLTIHWTTNVADQPLNSQVWYGVGSPTQQVANWNLTNDHTMTLTGLQPDTVYSIQAESSFYSDPDLKSDVLTVHTPAAKPPNSPLKTVFLLVLENQNWSNILNSPQAPYINSSLLPMSSYTGNDQAIPNLHPSEPNYLWLEAGTSFGITDDNFPATNHFATTQHLVSLIRHAGLSWKAYIEDIDGTSCPFQPVNLYTPDHNGTVFFDDVTGNLNSNDPYCIQHERPFSELANDLANGTTANYNILVGNLCDNMHDCGISGGDTWLSKIIPPILNSSVYQSGGVLVITWDENDEDGNDPNSPIGLIVLSPFAKGGGYTNSVLYSHNSTLRTIQEILGVYPLLGGAAQSNDLRDLFRIFP